MKFMRSVAFAPVLLACFCRAGELTPSTKLTDIVYVVFDFETTGLFPEVHAPIEMAAVKFRVGPGGEFLEIARWQTLIDKGDIPLPEFSLKTGFKESDFSGRNISAGKVLPVKEAFARFYAFAADADVLMAHYAIFDIGYLVYNNRSWGLNHPSQPIVDTYWVAKTAFPRGTQISGREVVSHGIAKLGKQLGITPEIDHHAANCAIVTARMVVKALDRIADRDSRVVGDLTWNDLSRTHAQAYVKKPWIAGEVAARYFSDGDTPAVRALADDWEERFKEADSELYKADKVKTLRSVAEHLGVSYKELVGRFRQRELERQGLARQHPD